VDGRRARGTLANLQQYIDIPDLHAIVISHEHPDHFVDLYPAFYAWHYGELGEPGLPVFVPTDFSQRLADLVSIDSQVAMRTAFAFTEVAPGEAFEIGPFRVKTEPMAHLGLPALGFRVAADGQVLAYTGDTGPPTTSRCSRATPTSCSPRRPGRTATTSCPSTCRRGRPGITRARRASGGWCSPTSGLRSITRSRRDQAAEEYPGPIDSAVEGMRFEVGS
jgi:ribonuclease BN (tRNA processing enzyme)